MGAAASTNGSTIMGKLIKGICERRRCVRKHGHTGQHRDLYWLVIVGN